MAKLLSIVWYKILPAMYGGQKGIAGFQQALGAQVPLTCLCSSDNSTNEQLKYNLLPELPTGKKQFANPFTWSRITEQAVKESPTHILLEHPFHAIAAYRAARKTGAMLIVHSHNIESVRFRALAKPGWQLLARLEGWIHRRADLSLFKTQKDIDWARSNYKLKPERCMLVPYGVTRPTLHADARTVIRRRHEIESGEKILFFAATLDYEPNAQALEDILERLVPLLNKKALKYKIIVAGRNKRKKFQQLYEIKNPNILVIGEVMNVEEYFQAADVFINPVCSGGGIQTKNIEALANDCTLVAFEEMASGIPKEICGDKILLAATSNWDNFADMVLAACHSEIHTPEAFFQYFDWQRIIKPLVEYINTHESKLNA